MTIGMGVGATGKAVANGLTSILIQRPRRKQQPEEERRGRQGRFTLVVHGRLTMSESRLTAAREARHGLRIVSFEQAAARLAGGFVRPIDD